MSDSTGPVRRRRIAGESKPEVPAGKTARRTPVRRPAKKAAAPKKAAPVEKPAPARKVAGPRAAVPTATPRPAPAARTTRPADSAHVSEQPRTSGPSWRRLAPLAVVAALVLAAGVFVLVRGIVDLRGGDDDLASARAQASSAAGSAAETIFSFRSDALQEHEEASKAILTDSFAEEFDKVSPMLTEVASQRKVVVEAVSREAAPQACGDECSPDAVTVLVFIDQARLIGSAKEPTVFANRISMSMVRSDDGWLVDNIRAL